MFIRIEAQEQSNSQKNVQKRRPNSANIQSETPYVKSLLKSNNIFWKSISRIPQETARLGNNCKVEQHGSKTKIKATFYQNLLKVQRKLNEKQLQNVSPSKLRKRDKTYSANSEGRRKCLQSRMQKRIGQNLIDVRLINRESSNISENYLKAKLQFQRNSFSSFAPYRIIKM